MPSDYAKIAEENLRKYGTEIDRIGEMLLAHRYSDRTHFVFELLQNAEDAIRLRTDKNGFPRSVCFTLKPDHLEFTHYGIPFEEKHVRAICGIGESTKEDELTAIGHFGIGFKSVYAFTKRPEIHSEGEHFAIEAFVRPYLVPERKTFSGQTIFYLPFSDQHEYEEILKRLKILGHRTLLFLKSIDSIEWKAAGGNNGVFLRKSKLIKDNVRRIILLGKSSGGTKEELEEWMVFDRDVFKDSEEKVGQVEIAFALNEGENGKDRITPLSDSPLVVFFATEKETHLGFLVQGPYKTTPSRDNVPKDDKWNQYLIAETAILVKESLRTLRDMDMLSVDTMRAMPLDTSKFTPTPWSTDSEQMFKLIFDAVKTSFLEEELIPKYKGGHVAGKCAKIARTEGIRALIDPAQLTELFKSDHKLSWVTEEVSRDRNPQVRSYLITELDVSEVETDNLLPRFTKEFFAAQSDDWISDFYAFLLDQPSLWRSGGFRLKPIIRIENGDQVVAFDNKGVPKVFLPGTIKSGFPTVKESVCKHPEALKFLKAFGLTAPDPVDDVIINVLPQFSTTLNEASYDAAIVKILSAFQTDSTSQRQKLLNALADTAFVKCRNAKSNEVKLKRPTEAYIPTENLVAVFSGVSTIWFVDSSTEVLRGDKQRRFLEACGVRDYLRRFECSSSLSWEELEELRRREGAIKNTWQNVVDYDVVGLSNAAKRISTLAPELAEQKALKLWSVLLETLRDARETFFKGTYEWGYVQSSWKASFPCKFVRDLSRIAWIPTIDGELRLPREICFSETIQSLRDLPNPILQELFGFRPEAIKQLAEESGVELAALELLKKHGLTSDRLHDLLKQVGLEQEQTTTPKGDSHENESGAEVEGAIDSILGGGHPSPPPPPPGAGADERPRGGHGPSPGFPGGKKADPHPSGSGGSEQQSRFFSYVYVSSGGEKETRRGMSSEEYFRREKVGREGVDYVKEHEVREGIQVVEMPQTNEGYDIELRNSLGEVERYIEVKATSKGWAEQGVTLSEPQLRDARRFREKYWLYVVENAGQPDCKLYRIQNPASKINNYVFDGGWKAVAENDQEENG